MANKFKDLSGKNFGRLTALYRLHNYHKKGTYWLCACDCGNLTEVRYSNLTNNNTVSCGCYNVESTINAVKKHGKYNTKLYRTWNNIKARCTNKLDMHYSNYGERGIKMCDEWFNDFMTFYNWSMDNGYREDLTIDRIDVNGNYEPNNCRWATPKQQARNRRNNRNYTINGETHCIKDWCNILGLKYGTVMARLRYGWNIEKALELNA